MDDNIESDFYKELLRSYLDSTKDAIFVLCDEMKFLLCNQASSELFGKAEKELTRHGERLPITEFLRNEDTVEKFNKLFPEVLVGNPVKFESLTQVEDANKWIEFSLDRVKIEDAPMVIVVARDITDRKEHEINLDRLVKERTRELEMEIEERRRAEEQALKATRAKSDFLASMNHELRNPLNSILGYAEIIKYQIENEPGKEVINSLKAIQSSGDHMLSIINDILDIAKIESGKLEINAVADSLKDCIECAMRTAIPMKNKNSNSIELHYETEVDLAHFDRIRVTQVLLNLISNACKFTHDGIIKIKVLSEEPLIKISVQDTGIGMTKKEINDIFKAYTQANKSIEKKYGGTGLGIPISQKLCKLMGGNLTASSQKNVGSCFEMSFEYY